MPQFFISPSRPLSSWFSSSLCSCLCSLAIATAGCASSGARANANGPARWTGTFRTSQYAASAVIGPAQPGRSAGYGSITVTPVDVQGSSQASGSRVEISINAPVPPGTQVGWAIFNGQCGSTSPPLIGAMQFPTIEIANSGNGSVRSVLPFTLDAHGTYHANVYWSAQVTDVSNVMMCANVGLDNR